MVSFLSSRKLNGYLVTAKIYPLEGTVGSYLCRSKQYRECNNITDTDSFICSNDQTNFKINHKFDCNEQSLIYLITCNRCFKQFLRPAADEFRHRWKNYKDNRRKFEKRKYCMQRHFYEHFNLSGHSGFLDDVSVTLIDKTYSKNSTERKYYWIYTFKPKHHWHLMLKMVFSHKLLYFAAMIIFMDGLYLNNNFRTLFLSFYCFHCCCCWRRYFIIIVVLFLYYTWSYTLQLC